MGKLFDVSLISILFFGMAISARGQAQTTTGVQESEESKDAEEQDPAKLKPLHGPGKGTLKPGECITLSGVKETGAKLCNEGTSDISYEVDAEGGLTVDAGIGGVATIDASNGNALTNANITIKGSGDCAVQITGNGCTVTSQISGGPPAGSIFIIGSTNTITVAAPSNVYIITTTPPSTPPSHAQNYKDNKIGGPAGTSVKYVGYDADGYQVVKNTINY